MFRQTVFWLKFYANISCYRNGIVKVPEQKHHSMYVVFKLA